VGNKGGGGRRGGNPTPRSRGKPILSQGERGAQSERSERSLVRAAADPPGEKENEAVLGGSRNINPFQKEEGKEKEEEPSCKGGKPSYFQKKGAQSAWYLSNERGKRKKGF